jgi:Ca-activated chloride channel family protein
MFNAYWYCTRYVSVSLMGALFAFSGTGVSTGHQATPETSSYSDHVPSDTIFIVGTVRNAATGLGIPGVNVTIVGNESAATSSDARGGYHLALTRGKVGSTVSLRFTHANFSPFTRDLRLLTSTVKADATLAPQSALIASEADSAARSSGRATNDKASTIAAATASVPRTLVKPGAIIGAAPAPTAIRMDQRELRRAAGSPPVNPGEVSDRFIGQHPAFNREQYDRIEDNAFLAVRNNPRSTFSTDVDRASYGNVRRFLASGMAPPPDAVRIEEMVNYFPYTLAQPKGADPIAITTEVAPAPWQPKHKLVRIALQARRIDSDALPPSNLVFLIDVSGSMNEPDKLPLVKESLRLLVNQLRERDRVALVVYAGNAGLVLPSTSGSNKARIAEAIDRLEAGGSTAGGAGLELAYRVAKQNFMSNGNNRVILATDGDFNVGASSDAAMERLIESKRTEGTYLTVLGFGTGNIQDAKMEKLAKQGNGNYAYVDNIAEARKTLVHEMGGTLYTVANDVKLQIEFNPAAVSAYRLIGYENRLLRDEDFTDDKKDAGDMGAGHSVTALYEIVPVGVRGTVDIRGTDSLRYGNDRDAVVNGPAGELLYVKLRYKKPGESTSKLMTQVVTTRASEAKTSDDFRFAASVASFGMLLRNSEYKGNATGASVMSLAKSSLGEDAGGYRAEFLGLVQHWQDTLGSESVSKFPRRDR